MRFKLVVKELLHWYFENLLLEHGCSCKYYMYVCMYVGFTVLNVSISTNMKFRGIFSLREITMPTFFRVRFQEESTTILLLVHDFQERIGIAFFLFREHGQRGGLPVGRVQLHFISTSIWRGGRTPRAERNLALPGKAAPGAVWRAAAETLATADDRREFPGSAFPAGGSSFWGNSFAIFREFRWWRPVRSRFSSSGKFSLRQAPDSVFRAGLSGQAGRSRPPGRDWTAIASRPPPSRLAIVIAERFPGRFKSAPLLSLLFPPVLLLMVRRPSSNPVRGRKKKFSVGRIYGRSH